MSAPKPHLTHEQSFHRTATTLPLDEIKAGMKACRMLRALAEGCKRARATHETFTPESLLNWLKAHDFEVGE